MPVGQQLSLLFGALQSFITVAVQLKGPAEMVNTG